MSFPSMSSPNYATAAARSMMNRAASRPKASSRPKNALVVRGGDFVLRGGHRMEDAGEDFWKPDPSSPGPTRTPSPTRGGASPGALRPDLCVQNAMGDVYPYALCPAQPAVQQRTTSSGRIPLISQDHAAAQGLTAGYSVLSSST
jgi:hypothetical protein